MNLATASRDGFEPAVLILLDAGAEPNDPRHYHSALSPLYYAAKEGHTRVVDILLANGANVNWKAQAHPRWTALHAAAANGQAQVVKRLINAGADINALASDGDPPLIQAVVCDQTVCARALLEAGANPSIRSPKHGTIAELAAQKGLSDVTVALHDRCEAALEQEDGSGGQFASAAHGEVGGHCMWLWKNLSRFVTVRTLLTLPFLPLVRCFHPVRSLLCLFALNARVRAEV